MSDESLAFIQTNALVCELRSRSEVAIVALVPADRRGFEIYIKGSVIELGGLLEATRRHVRGIIRRRDPMD